MTCTSDVRKPDREQFKLEIFVSTSSSPAILSEGRVRLQKQLTRSHSAPGKEGRAALLTLRGSPFSLAHSSQPFGRSADLSPWLARSAAPSRREQEFRSLPVFHQAFSAYYFNTRVARMSFSLPLKGFLHSCRQEAS